MGYVFKEALIEIAKGAEVTRGIDARLPWKGIKFDDMHNSDGTKLSLQQQQYYSQILGAFERER